MEKLSIDVSSQRDLLLREKFITITPVVGNDAKNTYEKYISLGCTSIQGSQLTLTKDNFVDVTATGAGGAARRHSPRRRNGVQRSRKQQRRDGGNNTTKRN